MLTYQTEQPRAHAYIPDRATSCSCLRTRQSNLLLMLTYQTEQPRAHAYVPDRATSCSCFRTRQSNLVLMLTYQTEQPHAHAYVPDSLGSIVWAGVRPPGPYRPARQRRQTCVGLSMNNATVHISNVMITEDYNLANLQPQSQAYPTLSVLRLALTIIHGCRAAVKNREGLVLFITWVTSGGHRGAGPVVNSAGSEAVRHTVGD